MSISIISDLKQSIIPQEKQEQALGILLNDKENTDNKLNVEQNSGIGKIK